MSIRKSDLAPLIYLAVFFCVIAGLTLHFSKPEDKYIQGEIEATEIDLAPKIPGRVKDILVRKGQSVQKNELLLTLDSPEVRAKLEQASAAEDAAAAQSRKAENGARSQEILAAEKVWLAAKHAADLASATYRRTQSLYKDGVIPAQRRDEIRAKYLAAREQADAARAAYDMAVEGARSEDRQAAEALVKKAAGAVHEVESLLEDAHLTSPLKGEVVDILADPGELVNAGFPVATIVDLDDVWVTFNLREDRLAGIRMGSEFRASFPALGGETVMLKVDYISPLGSFATWRATSASGGFDLKTFEVHARPVKKVEGLRPGMSALVPVEEIS